MSQSKHPPGETELDDLDIDALLDGLMVDSSTRPAETSQSARSPDAPEDVSVPPHAHAPSPARPLEPSSLASLFEDETEIPTRTVDIEEIKRAAGEQSESVSSGLGDLFSPERRPTAPPPPSLPSVEEVLGDAERTPEEEALEAHMLDEPVLDLALDVDDVGTATRSEAEPHAQRATEASEMSAAAEAGSVDEEPEAPAIEQMAEEEESVTTLEISDQDDQGPEFVTEESEETIDLEVGEEEATVEPHPVENQTDRGALVAATVTSRRRAIPAADIAQTIDARAEAEARVALLESEAEHLDSPERAAEWLAIAGELVEGVLGDQPRARALYERALERYPKCLFALRALRRFALAEGDVARALELCEAELQLPLSDEERLQLEILTGEIAARYGAAVAEERWEKTTASGGIQGALAQLFISASRRDPDAMGEALEALGRTTTGALAAAISLARARLAEGAAETDTALTAVQAAVQRDPSDVGSWLAMARLAIVRENAQLLRDALEGIARAGKNSVAAIAAIALHRATGSVLADTVEPVTVPSATVEGWLTVHALRDAGLDTTPQITAALAVANEAQRPAWEALQDSDNKAGNESDVATLLALQRAVDRGDTIGLATTAAALLDGVDTDRAALQSALLARKGTIVPEEIEPLEIHQGDGFRMPSLVAPLLAATLGMDTAESRRPPTDRGPWASALHYARLGSASDSSTELSSLAQSDAPPAVRWFAARQASARDETLAGLGEALAQESSHADEPTRAAGLKLLAAAIRGSGDMALEAARALPGEPAAGELVALFGTRGEIPPSDVAEVLETAAGQTLASRMSVVRAALRRTTHTDETERVAETLFKLWNHARDDGPLVCLTLRALPAGDPRRATVLRDRAERTDKVNPPTAVADWTLLAYTLAESQQYTEAARALARGRTHAPDDPALRAWEETLWLRAEMFAEVAERSFEALKQASSDEARIAAYEKLAELDSIFRQDVASAVLTYQAILELAPGHMASLRMLERYFLEQGRYDELLGIYHRLMVHVGDPDDATAIAHAAARIAIQQAEGDPGAGTPFWTVAFERGSPDLRAALALEGESRRTGDARRFVDACLRASALVSDPREKATFALRAGEVLLALGDVTEAVTALEQSVAAYPQHPVALTWLAFARQAREDFAGAAEALEALGRTVGRPAHAVEAFHRAAVLWQDRVGNTDRALTALKEVLARDPAHGDAFQRACQLLAERGDVQGERSLVEARVEAGGAPEELVPLRLRAAELCVQTGDPSRAREHLKAALALDADRQDALRMLAKLSHEAQDWTAAADAMIRLARLTTDAAERVELMFTLGELFDQHLNDPKRAEAAYKRVVQLRPGEVRALSRLADLYARTNDGTNEAETLRALINATPPGPARRALQIRLGTVLSEKLNEGKKAEEVLEAARREAPTDLEVLRAFARLYIRQQSPAALVVLLDRAAGEVRRTLDRDPTQVDQLELLADILKLRGRVDGARVVAAVAHSLGVRSEKLAGLSSQGVIPGAGAQALGPEVLELLAPPTITAAHRELLRLSADVLERLVPFDPGAWRANKLGARPHPLRGEIERWAELFGLEKVEIYLGPSTPLLVMPVGRHPPAVMLPVDLGDSPVARFAVVRALILVALSMALVVRLPTSETTLVMAALLRQFEPMFTGEGVDLVRLDELARRILRALPRERHAEMAAHAYEVIARKGFDGETLSAGAIELAQRMAVLASGDVAGAVAALTPPGIDPASAVKSVPAVGRLVRVVLSDRFLEARHVTGADRRGSQG